MRTLDNRFSEGKRYEWNKSYCIMLNAKVFSEISWETKITVDWSIFSLLITLNENRVLKT